MDSFEAFAAQPSVIRKGKLSNGDNYAVVKLAFHLALYVNPESDGLNVWYDARYCYRNLTVINHALAKFEECGELRYWHKDHKNQHSVHHDGLYQSGQPPVKEYLIRKLEWDIRDVDEGIFK